MTSTTVKDIRHFGHEVLALLQRHLSPGTVRFRGSFASGAIDAYSDVDVQAAVYVALDQGFFSALLAALEARFGPLSVRYDPDQRDDTKAQDLRISFHDLPVFWRLDLNITSFVASAKKWPYPFPEWSVARSAFWNVVWAVKYARRGQPKVADHYISAACHKLNRSPLKYAEATALTLLSELAEIDETDKTLIRKLREEIQ